MSQPYEPLWKRQGRAHRPGGGCLSEYDPLYVCPEWHLDPDKDTDSGARMSRPFDYRPPTDEQAALMKVLSDMFKADYAAMVENVPASAERTLAIRKLQEARMWINVAILGIEID